MKRDITVTLTFARHSEKEDGKATDENGNLSNSLISKKGHEMAREFGRKIYPSWFEKTYDVPHIERTTETLHSVLDGMEEDNRNFGKTFSLPGIPLAGDFGKNFMKIIGEHKAYYLSEIYPGKTWEDLTPGEQGIVIDAGGDHSLDWYLGHDKNKPFEDYESPYDFYSKVAYKLNILVNLADVVQERKKINLLSIGNKTSTEGLILYLLNMKSVKEIGGGLQPMEAWTFKVRRDFQEEKSVVIQLRGVEYEINLPKLKEMAEHGRILLKKERRKINS